MSENVQKDFLARRLHSLLGIIPLGVFLIQHLMINYTATNGAESFNAAAHFMDSLPFKLALETFIIYLPILFHGVFGIYIAFTGKSNVGRYSTYRNWMFLVQRITGVVAFFFIFMHVYQTRVQVFFGKEVNYEMVNDIISNPFWLVFYIIGILSTIFHFSNGLWAFLVSWGITQSETSQRVTTYITWVVFIVLSFIALTALFAFL